MTFRRAGSQGDPCINGRTRWVARLAAGLAIVTLPATQPASAANVTVVKVADRDTIAPGGSHKIGSVRYPALDAGKLIFVGSPSLEHAGVFLFTKGKLETVVDEKTVIPNTKQKFQWFVSPSLDGGKVFFQGGVVNNRINGLYTIDKKGEVTLLVNNSGEFAGQVEELTRFVPSGMDGGRIAFLFVDKEKAAIYGYANGKAAVLVSRGDVLPEDTRQVSDLGRPSLSAAEVVFHGSSRDSGSNGIYRWRGGKVSVVASKGMPAPKGVGTFDSFWNEPVVSLGKVALIASVKLKSGRGATGVYIIASDGRMEVVADSNTNVPSGVGTFTGFGENVSLDRGRVAFVASSNRERMDERNKVVVPVQASGIYTNLTGKLQKVVDDQTLVDGQNLSRFKLVAASVSGNQIAFMAQLEKTGEALFLATVAP